MKRITRRSNRSRRSLGRPKRSAFLAAPVRGVMPMTKELSTEDCEKCIGYLLDRSEDANTRVAAAESLMYCIGQAPKDALFRVLMDDSEPDYMREEAAGSLGTLWAESEIEYERLIQIQPPLLDEVLCDFDLYNLKLNKSKLGEALNLFKERYIGRKFMA